MKRLAVLVLILLLTAGIVYAKDYEVAKKAGDFQVTFRMDRNPPVAGENNAIITIRDASGNTITDAKVRVDYSMPAMPGMPPMNYKSDAALSGTEYRTNLNLSMAGSWNIIVKIAREGRTSSTKFSVDAR